MTAPRLWVVVKDWYGSEGLDDPADEFIGLAASQLGALGIVFEDGGPVERVYGDRPRYRIDADTNAVHLESERTWRDGSTNWRDENVWHIIEETIAP